MYLLREGDAWEDQGTGFVRLEDMNPAPPSPTKAASALPVDGPQQPPTSPTGPEAALRGPGDLLASGPPSTSGSPGPASPGPAPPSSPSREPHISLRWVVIDSEDKPGTELLRHRIMREALYELQGGGSIISWPDPLAGTSIALSFQDSMGCTAVWEHILEVQKKLHVSQESPRQRHLREDDYFRDADLDLSDPSGSLGPSRHLLLAMGAMADGPQSLVPLEVPTPSVASLPQLAEIFNTMPDNLPREPVMHPSFLAGLLDTFTTCEDLEDLESLHHCCTIVKGLISTNDSVLIDQLFKEENFMRVIGCLEYDPAHPQKANHREFLEKRVSYKEVVPLRSPDLQAKIHQTYQIGYVKDVVLASCLDEGTFSTLTSLIYMNNMEVMEALLKDQDFILTLFQRIKENPPTSQEGRDLLAFLQEFCSLAKHLDAAQQNQLFARLINQGIFDVITDILRAGQRSPDLQLRAADVLLIIAAHDTFVVRKYLLRCAAEAQGQPGSAGPSGERRGPSGELLQLLVRALLQPTEESARQSAASSTGVVNGDGAVGPHDVREGESAAVEPASPPPPAVLGRASPSKCWRC